MGTLIGYLYNGSAPLKFQIWASIFSIFVWLVGTLVLSKVVQKQSEDNLLTDMAVLLLVVYMMVEAICAAISISIDLKSDFIPKATVVMMIATLLFLLGTWYMYFQAYQYIKINVAKYNQITDVRTLLDETPFGKILAIYSAFTVLMTLMILFAGPTTDKIVITTTPFPIINIIIWLITPAVVSWYVSLTLPRKHYSTKLQKIIDLHNEVINVKQKTKKKNE